MEEQKSNYNILMLDDDDFLVSMYSAKFNASNISATICKDGNSILEKLKSGAVFDLILLDIIVPVMNGIEVLKAIRKDKLAENIPIVMLTNQNDESDIATAKSLNVSGYIVKSAATPSDVVSEVLKIIKQSKEVTN